jgi:putative transposon-encoded protein
MAAPKNQKSQKQEVPSAPTTKVRFEVYGEEMVEKVVKLSGNSGRVYLPPEWVGKQVKIIRVN